MTRVSLVRLFRRGWIVEAEVRSNIIAHFYYAVNVTYNNNCTASREEEEKKNRERETERLLSLYRETDGRTDRVNVLKPVFVFFFSTVPVLSGRKLRERV